MSISLLQYLIESEKPDTKLPALRVKCFLPDKTEKWLGQEQSKWIDVENECKACSNFSGEFDNWMLSAVYCNLERSERG